MSKFLTRVLVCLGLSFGLGLGFVDAQQLTNADFEDWSAAAFDGNPQPKGWNASNVTQFGFKFNFAHKETGHNGGYCMMVQDQDVGAAGITETSPGYFALGQPWVYVASLTAVSQASAGTYGGINWTYRPDTMSVWIKRTGSNWNQEDFYLLYYSWTGSAYSKKYKGKNGSCTSTNGYTDEESDIRQLLDGNECGTEKKATQIAEGLWRERKQYSDWVNIKVPIYYLNDETPQKMNIIFSASNYPNYRANSGLYAGNSLYVDDIQMIYASNIQKLQVGTKEWKGFDPNNTTGVQVYPLDQSIQEIPDIKAFRGIGTLKNAKGTTATFPGRELTGSEIKIVKGEIDTKPTTITVYASDGSGKSTTYKILFEHAASSNAKLATITYYYRDKSNVQQSASITGFNPSTYNYNVELPYGSKGIDSVTCEKQEDKQKVSIKQPTLPGTAELTVTAADGTSKQTYRVNFTIGKLADNTLAGINVNGKPIPGFSPTQAVYKVSLPTNTTTMPTVEGISAYPKGEQTITYTAPSTIDGGTYIISVTTPGNSVPKTYKLNFKLEASSYSYLEDLRVMSGTYNYITDFEPTRTTYYVNLPLGTTVLPTITPVKAETDQKVAVSELGAGVVDGTVRVTVTAANGDQTVYKIVFSCDKSDVDTLKGIKIGGVDLEGFQANVLSYDYVLPVGTTTVPEITPIPGDEYQTISVATAGVNGKARITVTAGDGSTKVYQITFSVNAYTNNTLKALYLDGDTIDGFDPEIDEYWVNLEQGTPKLPTVSWDLQDKNLQTAVPRPITGLSGDYKITVRPQGGASRTYIIHFSIATSSNNKLAMIYLDGTPLAGFDPAPQADTLHYYDSLPEGESKVPEVTFKKGEDSQRVLSVLEQSVQEGKRQVITVTAESGAKRYYIIHFIVRASENSKLEMIYLNGDSLKGFDKDELNYKLPLETATCPVITVDKAAGQQVTITAPYAAGVAQIKVQPESGSANTYTITFEASAAAAVQLSGILINGIPLAGFDPTKLDYQAQYDHELPNVEGVAQPGQTVQVLWKDSVAYVHVADSLGGKAAYYVTFSHILSTDTKLEGIYADGVLIPGFTATQLNYQFNLPAGSVYPEVSYKAADKAQVVFFGQVAEGKWGITVLAENGTPATYTVQYTIAKYNDVKLVHIQLQDKSFPFYPTQFDYDLSLDEGALLPKMTVLSKEGQTVAQYNENDTLQKVLVYAESGDTACYTITYHRVLSKETRLANIFVGDESLKGFQPGLRTYVDTIPMHSTVVPNVYPVPMVATQTVTTTYSRPNGITRILVEAQDGTKDEYTISFPTIKSSNTLLGDLYLASEEAEIKFKPKQTDYIVELPYSATECPKMVYEKDEEAQRIDVISRPLGDTSRVIVTAENGDTRTYNILFKRGLLKKTNTLSSIRIKELDQALNLKDKTVRNFDVNLPYGSRSMTVEYEKAYEEQTVFVQPGGVYYPTLITVKSNNDTIADEVYTLNPIVPTADPAVVTDIQVNNVTIPGFNPEKFSYIVQVTEKPKLRYTLNKGAEINIIAQSSKHWEAEVTYGEGASARTNTYHVWYYYPNEQVPNANFENWEAAATFTSAQKPTGWTALTDVLGRHSGFGWFDPDEICTHNDNAVDLRTKYSAPGGGNIPGFITLGNISGSWAVAGGTSFTISGGISFHNSPDTMKINYKSEKINNHNQIQYILTGSDGEKTLEWTNSSTAGYQTYVYDLTEANQQAGDPTVMNIILNSYHQVDGTTGNPVVSTAAEMFVRSVAFTYNHTMTSMKVGDITAAKSGNAFSATLTDSEYKEKPVLSFTGEVADQAQDVVWNNTLTKDANYETRTATIRNWAENGVDYSDYTLSVKRPLDTKNDLANLLIDTVAIEGFSPAKYAYTVVVPATHRSVPDVQPIPGSSLQIVTTAYNEADSTMTITVTPEKGSAKVYTVHFTSTRTSDTELANIAATGMTFDPKQKTYEIAAETMPVISFEKKSDLQVVTLNNGVISVTAEDGYTKGTYTITLTQPSYAPNGELVEFEEGDDLITGFGGSDMTRTAPQPAEDVAVKFNRTTATDTVIFVQNANGMRWYVPNSGKEYTWTYKSSKSSNATLKNITVNGVDLEGFTPSVTDYEITTDTSVVIDLVAADAYQTIRTTRAAAVGGVDYTTVLMAEDSTTNTYSLQVRQPVSNDATLAGILLDSVMIEKFKPDSTTYTVVLPVGAVKTEQPKMPSVTYLAAQSGQTITVEPGQVGEQTVITVQSEDGSATKYYTLTVQAEKSHCSDLTGITVNGEAIDYFEPGRHFYSVSVKTEDITVDYTTDDRFQQVDTSSVVAKANLIRYTIHVLAEDSTSSDYLVEVYIENKSTDAQLANILLDGEEFDHFRHDLNPDLVFDGGNNNYEINLPSTENILPEVSAQLKMNGQTVDIEHRIDTILLHVTATDGITPNTYVLHFSRPKSKNANLSMIFLDGDTLTGFDPEYNFYEHNLKIGDHTIPEVAAQKSEPVQTIKPIEIDEEKMKATIRVQAEDPEVRENVYVVNFHITQSDADTLNVIFEDGDTLQGFQPSVKYYKRSLPVGTLAFPDLSWQEANDLQTFRLDTVENDTVNQTLVRQIQVRAESGKKSVYTVSYTIEKSDIDTLNMLFIDQKPLVGFNAAITDYKYTLTAAAAAELGGALPVVEFIKGDEAQTVMVSQALEDSVYVNMKALEYKTIVTVTAASGKTKTYTIHYPVELSTDATLNMINVAAKPLANYDAERLNYRLEIEKDADVPVVSVIKKEEAQVYEINVLGDTVKILVWAENVTTTSTYTLAFERLKSRETNLRKIILLDADSVEYPTTEFPYNPEVHNYIVKVPFNRELTKEEQLPAFKYERYPDEDEQKIDTVHYHLDDGNIQVDVNVTAANGEDQDTYSILFQLVKPSDAMLASLAINGIEFADFRPSKTEYVYAHPYGSDSTAFFTADDVTYVMSDSLATVDTIYMDEYGFINVVTLAQDGRTSMTYLISQIIAKDADNALAWITVDGEIIPDFDPEVTFYTYYVFDTDAPAVDAEARSENAEVDLGRVLAGDTCRIICTAQDGTERYYLIHFAITDINPADEAKTNDVLMKPLPGTSQIFVGTIRQDVFFALYDQYGHLEFHKQVPSAAPNSIEISEGQNGEEYLQDISDLSSGLVIDVTPGKIYFYVFFYGNRTFIQMLKGDNAKKLQSGKFILR